MKPTKPTMTNGQVLKVRNPQSEHLSSKGEVVVRRPAA